MPPTGGFGGNCGVQDAFDLAWKLEYVLAGKAPAALLGTYDTERRPIGSFTTEQAYTRYVLRLDPGLGKENLMPIVHEATVELGYRHVSEAIALEAEDDGALWEDPHEPTGRPGMRAPHFWIDRDGSRVSTLDLFSRGFTLIAGSEAGAWCDAATAAAELLGVPLDAYRAGADFGDDMGSVAAAYGIGAEGASLVRPDGFVAWRARTADGDVDAALARALARS
jgi:hypothetical protein